MNRPKSKFHIFKEVFPNFAFTSYISELKHALSDCRSVLDLGCGAWSPVSFLDFEHATGVDACESTIIEAKKRRTHDEFILDDIRQAGKRFTDKAFDCCVALDIIEHLSKEDGYKLIRDMERIALKKVAIFTPNSFVLPYKAKNIELEEHLSVWNIDEMKNLGYGVVGIYGHKYLRGKAYSLRFSPKIVWGIISEFTQRFYTRSHPKTAAAILCLKKIGEQNLKVLLI